MAQGFYCRVPYINFVGRLRASSKTDLLFLSWSTGFKVSETHLSHLPVEAYSPTASRSGRALLPGIMYWLLYKGIFREQELILTTTPSMKYTINSAGIQLFNTINSLSFSKIKITEATTMLYLRDVL